METDSKEKVLEVTSNIDIVEETLVELEELEDEEEEEYVYPKRDDGSSPDYEVPGVEKVILDEEIQSNLGIIVGIDVTGEHPWKKISKELMMDNIVAMGNQSPFAPLKKQIASYEEDEILMGYLLDETNDVDEFYVCLTVPAKEYCEMVSEEFLYRQAQNLDESVVKQCGDWTPMGTENELNETIVKYNRPLIRINVKSKFPILSQTNRFGPRNAGDVRDGYIELLPVKAVTDNLFKKRIDAGVQVTPVVHSASAQTVPRFPRNIWTQCSKEDSNITTDDKKEEDSEEPPVELSDHEKHKREQAAKLAEKERELTLLRFRDFLYDKVPVVERIMDFNSTLDIYNLDYPNLVQNAELCKVENLDLRELIVFSDKRTKNLYITSVAWHPLHTQLIAVSYTCAIPNVTLKLDIQRVDEVKRAIFEENPVLVWSVFDSLKPKYYFESNSGISALSICIFDEDIFIGGCVNGQIVLWDARVLSEEEISEVQTDEQESNRQMLQSGMTWMKKIHDRYIVRTTVASDLKHSHNSVVTDISWISSHYEFNNFGKLTKLSEDAPRSKQFLSSSQDGTIFIWDLKIPENATTSENLKTNQGTGIPKVLIFEKSPYKVLRGKFKPIFRIMTGSKKLLPLLCMTTEFPIVNKLFEKLNKKGEREVYEIEDTVEKDEPKEEGEESATNFKPIVCLCTFNGEYIRVSWDGSGVSSREGINSSTGNFVSRSEFHDGMIVACAKNLFFKDIIATVGGRILAIWKGESQNKPIAWKYMKYTLKGASWSKTVPSQIYVLTDTGNIDIWDFLERSDMPVKCQTLTGTYSTSIHPHILFDKYIMGIADLSASLSIYSMPNTFVKCDENEINLTKRVFDREHDVREAYIKWSEEWYKNNSSTHDRYKKVTFKEITPEKKLKPIVEANDAAYGFQGAKMSEKLPPSLQRVAAFEQKWKRMQWEGVELAIQIRKALNKAELQFFEKPLRDVEAQKRSKRRKILDALENRNKIFEESLEILFPEAVPEEPPIPDIKPVEMIMATRKEILTEYDNERKKCREIVKNNLYEYSFSWGKEITRGKDRSRNLDERAKIFSILNAKIHEQILRPPEKVELIDEKKTDSKEIIPGEVQEGIEKRVVIKPPSPSPLPSPVLSDKDSDSD